MLKKLKMLSYEEFNMKIARIYGSLALIKKGKIILGKTILILQKLNNKFIE
jgi:hypothetical protein